RYDHSCTLFAYTTLFRSEDDGRARPSLCTRRETIPRLSGGTGKNELASSIMSRARRVPFAAAPCTLDMMRPVRNMLVPPLPWGMVLLRSAGIAVPIFA